MKVILYCVYTDMFFSFDLPAYKEPRLNLTNHKIHIRSHFIVILSTKYINYFNFADPNLVSNLDVVIFASNLSNFTSYALEKRN